MNDNVIDVPPASFQETYSGHRISYTFVPAQKQWHWVFEVPAPLKLIRFEDLAISRQTAIKAAHKMIDKL
jgi:hypothetical protein